MIKTFTFTLPDGPYLQTHDENNTVNCVYDGPKWLCFAVENGTHRVRNLEIAADHEEDLQFEHQIEEGHYHIKVTATDHPMIAAYFTHSYTHEEVPDIDETLTDSEGETFTFQYHYDDSGVMGQVSYNESVYWDPNTETFSGPQPRAHANSREETLKQFAIQADNIDANLDSPDTEYSAEDEAALRAHATWLRSIPTKYADIPHWKIPFPVELPTLQ